MRVAYLISRYPAVSHAFIEREVLALRAAGVEVETFTLRRAGDSDVLSDVDRAERDATHAIQPIKPARVLSAHLRALARPAAYLRTLGRTLRLGKGARGHVWQLFYFAEAIVLRAELRKRGLNHVHVHFANPAADVAMLATAFDPELRWSLTLHGPAEFFDVSGNRLPEKLSSAAFVACASDWARSQAMALLPADGWGHLRVIRGGVDTSLWRRSGVTGARRDGESQALREGQGDGLSQESDPLQILNVGRLAPVKGQALLVEAVAKLRERGVAVQCRIVGDGPERAALAKRIVELEVGDAVQLSGPVGQDRIRELYEQADVFCLPSFREGLPFVLIEALSMELAVVATRIMGIPELVTHGESGLLVTPARVDELADSLEQLARDPDLRSRLGRAGRASVQRDYEMARLAEELRSAFAVADVAADSTHKQSSGTV